ncbi:MAG: hypothetical protein OS130_05460 [Thermodesulfobacteriota bacterium]|jgi:uncharacterized protein (PEP-CTERM system associated)|nr:MAG: hypothetical protein OS130_05460 [Thermodesulfobacteriota bacterium]
MEQGYWGNFFEREFKVDRKVPLSLSIALTEEYDDNIFCTEKNQSRDLITFITPRIQFNSSGPRYTASLDYLMPVTRYSNLDPASGRDRKDLDYVGHNLSFYGKRLINDTLKVGMEELFILSRRPTDMWLGTDRISAAKYYRNWFSPYVEKQLSDRVSISLRFRYDRLHYLDAFNPDD